MRKQKRLFNNALIRYNKYRRKLQRLEVTGRNVHRQAVLRKHISRLHEWLSAMMLTIKKASAVGALATAALLAAPTASSAQDFITVEVNPFNLTDVGNFIRPTFADLDNDGDLDMLTMNGDDEFHYFENIGTTSSPSYAPAIENPFGLVLEGGYGFGQASFVDLDNDGDFDLMVGTFRIGFHYYENTGTSGAPAFASAAINPFNLAITPNSISYYSGKAMSPSFADLDGDGDYDLLAGDFNGDFHYFENIGSLSAPSYATSTFNPLGLSSLILTAYPSFVDIDEDGDVDMVAGDYSDDFYFFENTGSVTAPAFAAPRVDRFNWTYNTSRLTPVFADLDNDGDQDMVFGSGSGTFYYFENIKFVVPVFEEEAVTNPFNLSDVGDLSHPTPVDLDNDGDLDVLSGDADGNFYYFENIGSVSTPSFASFVLNPFGLADIGSRSAPSFADLDNDGDQDMISGESDGNFYYFENAGSVSVPSFANAILNPFGIADVGMISAPSFVDLDNDGDQDIMAGEYDGDFYYFENTGSANTPSFVGSVLNAFGLDRFGDHSKPSFLDFDKDGDQDMMVGDYDGGLVYIENIGTLAAPVFDEQDHIESLEDSDDSSPFFVDLDNDGDLDILSGGSSGNFYYYEDVATSVVMDKTMILAGETATVTITFRNEVFGFTNDDLTVSNGTLSLVGSTDGDITFTATFTPSVGIEDATNVIALDKSGFVIDILKDGSEVTDQGTAESQNFAIDTKVPTAIIEIDDTSINGDETATVTITFSESVSGFTNDDLTIPNGTLSAVSSADGDITFTATFTPSASVEAATNVITLDNTGISDAAGNAGAGTTDSENFAIDTEAPTATVEIDDASIIAGETATVTITFSEAVSGFTNDDLTIPNGTLSALSSGNGDITFTATFTPSASIEAATNVITLDNTGISDAAGNAGAGTTDSENFAIDTEAPTATVEIDDAALIAGETATVTITFSEAVSGFTNDDLTIPNGTLSAVSSADGDITFTATFTPSASVEAATNVITLDNTGLSDAAGNAGAGTTDSENFAIDTEAPTATVEIDDASLIAGETATVTITFSESVSGFTNDDLTIPNGILSAVSSGDGDITFTATFTPSASVEAATNVITLDNTGISDAAGNAGAGTTDSENFAIDTEAPTATIEIDDTSIIVGETATVTIAFSESVSGFTNDDLTIPNGTLSAVSSADGDITFTATFTPSASVEAATNVITLDNTGISDAAGNAGAGTTDSENFAIDTEAPTATVEIDDASIIAGETATVTITFSESVSGFTNDDLTIPNGTLSALSSGDGDITFTATFTPSASVEAATNVITLDNTGMSDAAGNAGAGTTDSENFEIDTEAPTATVEIDDTSIIAGETATVTITFSEAVTGFTNDDLTLPNGTLSALSSGDGDITFTATFTPSASVEAATNVITLDNTGISDAAGNAGAGTTDSENFAIDTQAPTATVEIDDTSIIAGETATVTITFSESVSGFTNDDLTIPNGTLSVVSSADGDITFTATFTPSASVEAATNVITLDNTGISDAAGNAGAGTTDSENFAIDTEAPTATVEIDDASIIAGETATVTITFSESVSGFTNDDLTIPNGTLSALSSADGDITFTATFTPSASVEAATNVITLDNTGISDAAGNAGAGTTDSENFAIDSRPTWTGVTDSDWSTATNWAGNVIPVSIDHVIITDVANDPIITSDIEVTAIDIQTGAVLTITSNSLKVNNATALEGSMAIASGASFVPLGTVAGSGSATVNRNTTFGTTEGKYSIVGSPITAGSTSSLGSLVYGYNETIAYDPEGTAGAARFEEVSAPETMAVGDAYFSANTGDIFFTGTPNSGNANVSLIYDTGNDGVTDAGFNLVSNPYTAAISYTSLMAGNSDIDGTIYLWDDGGSESSQRTNADYITANSMGAASGGSARAGSWDGYIRSAQGFFVKATTAGTLNFTPAMMDVGNNSDGGFFRTFEPEVVRFSLSSETAYNDILIGFAEQATVGLDRTLDAQKIKGNGKLQLYSRAESSILAIQALPASKEQTIVDLGFDASEAGTYTLKIEDLSSYGSAVLLIDHLLGESIELSVMGAYSFSTAPVENSSRFSLVFAPDNLLANEDSFTANSMTVFSNDHQVNVRMSRELKDAAVSIYSLGGVLIKQVKQVNFVGEDWATDFDEAGVFIISIQSGSDVFTKKFIK